MKDFVIQDNVEILKDKKEIYEYLIKEYHNPKNQRIRKEENAYNFEILTNTFYENVFVDFYLAVKTMCETHLEVFENPKPHASMMAYVSNQEYFDTRNHRHCEFTDELIAVYYLSVPEGEGGEIGFYKNEDESSILGTIKPKENDILIFPATSYHKPFVLQSNDYRISLNIGLNATYRYNKDKE